MYLISILLDDFDDNDRRDDRMSYEKRGFSV